MYDDTLKMVPLEITGAYRFSKDPSLLFLKRSYLILSFLLKSIGFRPFLSKTYTSASCCNKILTRSKLSYLMAR